MGLHLRLLVNTASIFKGGGVQVAASFLRECCAFADDEFVVILGPGLASVVQPDEFPKNFEFSSIGYRPAERVFSLRGAGRDLKQLESAFQPDVVFTTSGPSYWRPRAPHLMGFNLPHHLYPDSPYFSQVLGPLDRLRWRAKSMLIRHYTRGFADAWVVQTDDVNQRLRRWIGSDQVYTVPNTISSAYLRPAGEGVSVPQAPTAGAQAGFRLLVLSSYYRHKNLEILNGIIALLRERGIDDLRFTMTLPAKDFERAIALENRGFVDNLGPQRPEDCPPLYQASDALFLPTLLECFSANYVEAMAMGRPIVTTDLGFAHTTCSDAALYFEPLNAEQALGKILELRGDSALREGLVARGKQELVRFGTARGRAEAYLSLCLKLAERKAPLTEGR